MIEEIVKNPEISGGRAIIKDTRICVMDVVEAHYVLGYAPEKIAKEFGTGVSKVFSALAYYHEHREEIEKDIRENKKILLEKLHSSKLLEITR
ncbi:MAG: DUF433 domain-containing protein [Candidatus Aenigmarchaeota archaeon]|nr:DUF433 domain-containing protein [Candidatus Aenigmarchaeota archaeon]